VKTGNDQLLENAGTEGRRRELLEGAEDAIPIVMAAAPFGALFGAAAAAQGLPGFEIILASFTIYAGASQFVFLELYGLSVPAWSVVLAVFAVNFRHILYGASIGRRMSAFRPLSRYTAFFFLTDPQWAASEVRSDGPGLRPAYYFGFVAPLYSLWMVGTVIGVWFGSLIKNPATFGFDMLLPIYFLAILMGFRKRVNWLPIVLVSGISSSMLSVTIGPPWHISLGGLTGLIVAAFLPLPKGKEETGGGEDG
jgi:predicted branched-subunit amino acid permease